MLRNVSESPPSDDEEGSYGKTRMKTLDFDLESQTGLSNHSSKVWSYPRVPGSDLQGKRQAKEVSWRPWSMSIHHTRLIKWLVAGYAALLIGMCLGLGCYFLTESSISSPYTMVSSVLLLLAPIGPALYLAIFNQQFLIWPGAVLSYSWCLISLRCDQLPICVAFIHLVLMNHQENYVEVLLVATSLAALGIQGALCPSFTMLISLLFILWGNIRWYQTWIQMTDTKKEFQRGQSQEWLVLSVDEINTEQIRQEIILAKDHIESKQPGLLERIKPLAVAFERIKINRKVGFGSFGEVYKGVLDEISEVAIKRVPKEQVSQFKVSSMLTEIGALANCHHPNIVKLFGWSDDPYVMVILEFANGGSMKDFLQTQASQLSRGWCLVKSRMAMDAASGLAYLHSRGLLHRDIKADNLLVFTSGENSIIVKLGDFGSSRPMDCNNPMTAVGSPFWLAPEVAKGVKDYDTKADVWSFGVCLCEMATHCAPYEDVKSGESYFNLIGVSQGKILPSEQLVQASNVLEDSSTTNFGNLVRLVDRCCMYDPRKRPRMNMIMFELLQMMVLEDDGQSNVVMSSQRHFGLESVGGSWKTENTSASVRKTSSMRVSLADADCDKDGSINSPVASKRDLRRISDPVSARKSHLNSNAYVM